MALPGGDEEGDIVEVRDGAAVEKFEVDDSGWVVQVGQIVLLRISPSTHRPLLVHTINHDGTIAGELFLNWEEDMKTAWVREHCFYPPDSEHRSLAVKRARRGTSVGEWEPLR